MLHLVAHEFDQLGYALWRTILITLVLSPGGIRLMDWLHRTHLHPLNLMQVFFGVSLIFIHLNIIKVL